ncbi:MAG: PAS domain S-box protein [Candidatus Lambdaproteobacteria bacterium]|nr:PAS domain S-box protein [Candidatus Lambdaproteobacteria bacterium]
MNPKPAETPAARPERDELDSLRVKVRTLELERSQMKLLLDQGFNNFQVTADKLGRIIENLNDRLETKNQELERNLAEMEKVKTYLANIFESLAVGVLVTDVEGHITSVNRRGVQILGLGAEQLIGQPVHELLGIAPVHGTTSGQSRADLEDPVSFVRVDRETLKLKISVSPMPGGFILNVQDVTQLIRLEETAERRNRFTAMGEMAANIAHEIRNPLGSIELFASLVRKSLPPNTEPAQLINHISSAVASMNHIISNLLAYTKPRPVNRDRMHLGHLLRDSAEFLGFLAEKHNVTVHLELKARRTQILGDEEMLKQVVHNLFLNAVQAMPDGGTLTIATRNLKLTDARQIARFQPVHGPTPAAQEVIEVSVRDTGAGMPEEIQKQVFDPFFTTKARGTGLGLAIVHNIIEAHRATIDLESAPNVGTNMILTFPVTR